MNLHILYTNSPGNSEKNKMLSTFKELTIFQGRLTHINQDPCKVIHISELVEEEEVERGRDSVWWRGGCSRVFKVFRRPWFYRWSCTWSWHTLVVWNNQVRFLLNPMWVRFSVPYKQSSLAEFLHSKKCYTLSRRRKRIGPRTASEKAASRRNKSKEASSHLESQTRRASCEKAGAWNSQTSKQKTQ